MSQQIRCEFQEGAGAILIDSDFSQMVGILDELSLHSPAFPLMVAAPVLKPLPAPEGL